MSQQFRIDSLDRKILSFLTTNARTPFLEIARECHVSGAAIHQRVQKLVDEGVIVGSQFHVSPTHVGYTTCAYMGLFLKEANLYKRVLEALGKVPEIVECHYTTGNYSLFIKIYARTNDHLKRVLAEKLQAIEGIARTETFISLEESFKRQIDISIK